MSISTPISFALPSIGDEEISEVTSVLRSGWLTSGMKAKQFEKDFSEYVGANHAMAMNSATSGLHLALEAIGVKAGDQVITTPYTFTATAEVIRYLGADPIFVDIDPHTFNIDPKEIAKHVGNKNIKAIIPVHFAGQSCDMDPIMKIAQQNHWKIVEDAAHALPSTYKGQMIGTLGDLTVYSFYVTKTIATGEGGMVVTNHKKYVKHINTMRLHGINSDVFDRYTSTKPKWHYSVVAPGYKYNLTDIAAALGIQQLKKAWKFHERRKWIAAQYNEAFKDLPMRIPHIALPEDVHSWHLYMIQLDLEHLNIGRDRFIEILSEMGIGTSVHFIPLHTQPYWKNRYNYQSKDFPIALDVYQRAVSLPIYPKMTDESVYYIIEMVRAVLGRYAK